MARKYRVLFRRVSQVHALFHGRLYTDWYVAECRRFLFWQRIGTYPTRDEADQACEHHAGGTLIAENVRVVSEFERKD